MILHLDAKTTGSYTIGGAADCVRYCLNNPYLLPTAVISFGICFGCHEFEQKLCDTVISDHIYPYFIGAKITEKGTFVKDDNMFTTDDSTKILINKRVIEVNAFREFPFDAFLGHYISGEAVISKKEVREQVKSITTQKVFAGDMEAYGLYKECHSHKTIIPCITVKSISDWAIKKNPTEKILFNELARREAEANEIESIKDNLQALAVYHSWLVLKKLIDNGVFKESLYQEVVQCAFADKEEKTITENRLRIYIGEAQKQIYPDWQIGETMAISIIHTLVADGYIKKADENHVGLDNSMLFKICRYQE